MALANKVQLTYWGAAAAISGVVFWVLGDMLLPFLIGIAIAYFLDPAADILERWGLSRSLAVLAITLASLVILLPVLLFITTTLIGQLSALNNLSFSEEKIIEIPQKTSQNHHLRRVSSFQLCKNNIAWISSF